MIYLGGVFYPIAILGQPWQFLSQFNPILYMVNGLRYSFIGESDVNIWISLTLLIVFNLIFMFVLLHMLKKGYGIRT
jgi:ABC-2 type transport system permease protein